MVEPLLFGEEERNKRDKMRDFFITIIKKNRRFYFLLKPSI